MGSHREKEFQGLAVGWFIYMDVAHDNWRNWGGEENSSAIAKVFSGEGKRPGVKQIKAMRSSNRGMDECH